MIFQNDVDNGNNIIEHKLLWCSEGVVTATIVAIADLHESLQETRKAI